MVLEILKTKDFKYPLRLGKKQKRAVLDAEGNTIVVFDKKYAYLAELMVELFNKNYENNRTN